MHPMDVYPLMINCNGFHVGGASWSRHREEFPGSTMTGFLRSQFQRFLRKEEFLNRFFYSEFDAAVLEERKARRRQSGLKDPKEEPIDDMTLDLENRQYSFYLCPRGGEA